MYEVVTEEHNLPPKFDKTENYKVPWAGEFHLKYVDKWKIYIIFFGMTALILLNDYMMEVTVIRVR